MPFLHCGSQCNPKPSHRSSGLLKALVTAAKEKEDLALWRPAIINHLYWTAASTLVVTLFAGVKPVRVLVAAQAMYCCCTLPLRLGGSISQKVDLAPTAVQRELDIPEWGKNRSKSLKIMFVSRLGCLF